MPKTKTEPTPDVEDPTDSEVRVEFNGHTFSIPKDTDEWPTVAWLARIEATTTNRTLDWMRFIELLLGPGQWRLLTSVTASTKGEFNKFLDAFGAAVKEECAL